MNVQDLQAALDTVFSSWTGPPRAYFEIELPMQGNYPSPLIHPQPFLRIVYKIFALGIEASVDDTTDFEDILCRELHKRFMSALTPEQQEDQTATLIWRRSIRYDADLIQKFDEGTGDYVPVEPRRVRHRISMRCYCPRAELVLIPKPEGEMCEMLEPRFLV